ncbi:MAG: DUF58 domain-containing protein [Thermotogota bacterium]
MKTDYSTLLYLSIISIVLNFIFFNFFSLTLLGLSIFLWFDFKQKEKALKNLEFESYTEYRTAFKKEAFFFATKIKNTQNIKLILKLSPASKVMSVTPKKVDLELNPGEEKEFRFRIYFNTSGEHFFGNTFISIENTYFLYEIHREIENTQSMKILHDYSKVEFDKEEIKRLLPERKSKYNILEDTTYIDKIDEYDGEPMNRIHWKATAKLDKLMVKKFNYTSTGKIYMFTDLNISKHSPINNLIWKDLRDVYENYAIKASLGLIKLFCERKESLNVTINAKNTKKLKGNNLEMYFDEFSSIKGEINSEKDLDSLMLEEIPYMTVEDTVIIISQYLDENSLPEIIKVKSSSAKVIVFLMPQGFKEIWESNADVHSTFRKEIRDLKKSARILEENNIIVRLVSFNDTLIEVFQSV